MDSLIVNSYAKLNLFLSVLNLRPDNYHNIETIFERISLFDKITLKKRRDNKIRIISSSAGLPKDSSNLAYRSAKLIKDKFGIDSGVDIAIIKRIPIGAGLGGGSSDAAGVLTGLNKLWGLGLKQKELIQLAAKIGSDVPFFIYGVSFAQGLGRGEKIKPLKALGNTKLWHLLVVPKIKVSTPLIYKKWDEYLRLTKPSYGVRILPLALKKKDVSLTGRSLFNSLEEITARLYPEVGCIREKLVNLGLKAVLMSGSGPAVFGIVASRREAEALRNRLKKEFGSWQVFVVRTA
ncbi:MAG: 4-(cytidine 5'-diphospho)-2-C-methyl-D-erythritol kinase [Candidatus Omnitrophica bacterium]|nr:4-(cytidine 5'-diphospho)-2-C-methyl-D-erythritol kinase [Candidatus Omnitrophota bacterium]